MASGVPGAVHSAFSKPRLLFLHGNVQIGYCEEDSITGLMGKLCSLCGKPFLGMPILYPVKQKNYVSSLAISAQWDSLKQGLKSAFMLTVFGYSGPKTDQEAIALMDVAWGGAVNRPMEQTAFITLQTENEINAAWDKFIHSHHYEIQRSYFESWIAMHPRRTGEAYCAQYIDAKFVENNPAPTDVSLSQLHKWYEQLLPAERRPVPNLASANR